MELVQCVYCSASAKADFSRADLDALLDECRKDNASIGVTGMLLYHDNSFFQILEGDRPVVEALFKQIERDKRHNRVTKIILEPIEERSFGSWTMGYANVTTKELAEIPGLNDFFAQGTSFLELGAGRAKMLLGAFKEGRWRRLLS